MDARNYERIISAEQRKLTIYRAINRQEKFQDYNILTAKFSPTNGRARVMPPLTFNNQKSQLLTYSRRESLVLDYS